MRILKYLVFLLTVMLFSCENMIVKAPQSNQNLEDFEATWVTVNSVYQYLEFKHIDWDSVYTLYRPLAESARGDEIYQVLHDMLALLKDGHIFYQTDGGGVVYPYFPRRQRKDRNAYSPFVVRKYFNKKLRLTEDGKIEYEILQENIGYIYIAEFPNEIKYSLAKILEYVKDTKAMIIDVRNNRGGNRVDVDAIVCRFITSPLERPVFYKLGKLTQLPPIEPEGSFQYSKPVVILINGVTFSAAEIFVEEMKQLSNVTVIGDTTGGGSSGFDTDAPGKYELPSGKLIKIPTVDSRRYDGLPFEWIGIAPDARIIQTENDIKKEIDKQLEYAIDMLK